MRLRMAARPPQPAVRAGPIQDLLDFLDAWQPSAQQRVRARVPEPSQRAIDGAPRRGWIPLAHHVHVPTAIFHVLGDEDASRVLQAFSLRQLDTPILRGLARKTTRLFGLTPISALRMLPVGWGFYYRDVCRIEVAGRGGASLDVVLRDLAPEAIAAPAYLWSFRAILGGVLAFTGFQGEVAPGSLDAAAGTAVFRVHWEEAAARA